MNMLAEQSIAGGEAALRLEMVYNYVPFIHCRLIIKAHPLFQI